MSDANLAARRNPPAPVPTQVEVVSSLLPAWAWVMAVLFAFAAGVACLCFTVLLLSSNVAWMCLVDEKHDDQAYVAAKVLSGRLRQADIVVFGTSSTREALWHEDALQTAIEPVGGRAKEIVILASSEQSPIEALFLATLGETRSGQLFVVFLGFGALHFNSPFEKLEILLVHSYSERCIQKQFELLFL